MSPISRRGFTGAILIGAAGASGKIQYPRAADEPEIPSHWPRQDLSAVREVVGASHRDLERVRALVIERPALANAAWDWGFGDWETALGAASHTGRREIAEFLLSQGARMDIFAAAMLGNLAAVRAMIEAKPGMQRVRGPHGIPLLAHAEAGGDAAASVVDYLQSIEGAGDPYPSEPLDASAMQGLTGKYRFAPGDSGVLEVTIRREFLEIARIGDSPRQLVHRGGLEFFPVGATNVRIKFTDGGVEIDDRVKVVKAVRET